jgi:serine/threonine protein kinase
MRIEDSEWEQAEKIAIDELRKLQDEATISQYSGLIKIRKKDSGLNHSFMAIVTEGRLQLFAMARKNAVFIEAGEGILGKGGYGEVAIAKSKDGTEIAMKYQRVTKNTEKERLETEMALLKIAEELFGEGFLINKKGVQKHYALMKRKQGQELFKSLYIPITEDEAKKLRKKKIKVTYDEGQPVTRRELSRKEQLLFAVKISQGIEFLHDKNIVHRDIKPDNIMVRYGEDENIDIIIVSLIDLGLAHQLESGEDEIPDFPITGTPSYMAPEVWGPEGVDAGILHKANDIYALGILFRDDLGMKDKFIKKMLNNNYQKRPDIEVSRKHFEELLRNKLYSEMKKEITNTQHKTRRIPPFSTKFLTSRNKRYKKIIEQQVEEKMKRILAGEAELLKELNAELEANDKEFLRSDLEHMQAQLQDEIISVSSVDVTHNDQRNLTLSDAVSLMNRMIAMIGPSEKTTLLESRVQEFNKEIENMVSDERISSHKP